MNLFYKFTDANDGTKFFLSIDKVVAFGEVQRPQGRAKGAKESAYLKTEQHTFHVTDTFEEIVQRLTGGASPGDLEKEDVKDMTPGGSA